MPPLQRQLALFSETRKTLGKPPATEIPLIKECYVAQDTATAVSEARSFLGPKYEAYRQWEQDKALPAGETFASDMVCAPTDPRSTRRGLYWHPCQTSKGR